MLQFVVSFMIQFLIQAQLILMIILILVSRQVRILFHLVLVHFIKTFHLFLAALHIIIVPMLPIVLVQDWEARIVSPLVIVLFLLPLSLLVELATSPTPPPL